MKTAEKTVEQFKEAGNTRTGRMTAKRQIILKSQTAAKGKLSVLVLAMLLAFMLAGCASTKLAESFDQSQVEEMARTVVDNLIAGKYEEDIAMMSQAMQEALTAEALESNMEMMNEQTGAFKEYKSTAVVGQKNSQGGDMAVVVIVAAFEKRNVTYTVTFNTDMEVDGLWMK